MTILQEEYRQLLSLTQLYLLSQPSLKKCQLATPATYAFFKKNFHQKPFVSKSLEDPFLKTASFQLSSPSISSTQDFQPPPVEPQPAFLPPPHPPTPLPPVSPPNSPLVDPLPPVVNQVKLLKGQVQPHLLSATIPVPSVPPVSPPPAPPTPLPPVSPPNPPLVDPLPPVINQIELKSKTLQLEPLKISLPVLDQAFVLNMQAVFPQIQWNEKIPSDHLARKKRGSWNINQEKTAVVILLFDSNEEQLAFLKNVAHAISLRLAPTQILLASSFEKNNTWNHLLDASSLRLIIANDYGVYLQSNLKSHYRESSQQGKHFLKNIPLLLLSDISLYLKQPQLKSLLWRAICNELALISKF